MTSYTIDGVRIYAREEGPRTAQLALLIHGWSSSWYAMSPLLPLLSSRFRCVAVDLPGYGNSSELEGRITIPRYADVLASLLRELTDQPVVLVGHSMGGMISVTMALRHPQLIERMVLLCPTISGKLSTYINLFVSPITMIERFPLADRITTALEPYTVQITDRLMRPASFSERTAITQQEYERLRADARRHGQGRVRAECYRAMRSNDLRGTLAKVERPALVIWGAEDNTVPLRDAGVVADEWRNADLRIVPKAGHWPQFETPDTTHRFVAAYLGLPVVTTRLEDSTTPAAQVTAAAAFLAHSDIGAGLTLQQRSRLAAQLRMRSFTPGALISQSDDDSSELVVVQRGSIEIWSKPVADDPNTQMFLANVLPGQITGEIALIDGGLRSAELRAGEDGATVLLLRRDRLVALSVDDPSLGNAVIWNIAAALALRLRLINWQQQMAIEQQRATMGN